MLQELMTAFRARKQQQDKTALEKYLELEARLDDIESGKSKQKVTLEEFEAAANAIGIGFEAVAERLKLRAELRELITKRDHFQTIYDSMPQRQKEHEALKAEHDAYLAKMRPMLEAKYAEFTGAMNAQSSVIWHQEKITTAQGRMDRLLPALDA